MHYSIYYHLYYSNYLYKIVNNYVLSGFVSNERYTFIIAMIVGTLIRWFFENLNSFSKQNQKFT